MSAEHAIRIEARLYDRLFDVEDPEEGVEDFTDNLNPKSVEILTDSYVEPSVADDPTDTRYQFEREGYFWQDPVDSAGDRLVFNRIVALKDSWSQAAKAKPAVPKPKAREATPTPLPTRVDTPETIQLAEDHGLSIELARQLFNDADRKALFDEVVTDDNGLSASIANWIVNELPPDATRIDHHDAFRKMISLLDSGEISQRIARQIQSEVLSTGTEPSEILEREGLAQISDPGKLEALAEEIISKNGQKADLYRSGKKGLIGFFMGQLMQASSGKANPELAREIIEKKLG